MIPLGFPVQSSASITIFTGGQVATATNSWQTWAKPVGITYVFLFALGGGGGGGGSLGASSVGASGGGSASAMMGLYPAFLVPDTLYVKIGEGGLGGTANPGSNGGNTLISSTKNTSSIYALALGNGGGGGTAIATAGIAGSNPTFSGFGNFATAAGLSGGGGGAGATAVNGNGTAVAAYNSGRITTGGSGGGHGTGSGGGVTASITGPLALPSAPTSGTGANGIAYNFPPRGGNVGSIIGMHFTGGAGGGGEGGRGGNGSYGCGGGGGGGGTPTSIGGNGGPGMAIIVAW